MDEMAGGAERVFPVEASADVPEFGAFFEAEKASVCVRSP
jgi:hypothetical protein